MGILYSKTKRIFEEEEEEEIHVKKHKKNSETNEQIIEELRKENLKLQEEKFGKTIFTHGLPPIKAESIISSPVFSSPKNRFQAVINEVHNVQVFDVKYNKTYSSIWTVLNSREKFVYANESGIKTFVEMVINDCVNAMGLAKEIVILSEIQILGDGHDVLLIYSGFSPIGVILVKKPGKAMNDEFVLGQSFDYLNMLNNLYGIKYPFVILSTYMEWRLVWLNSSETNNFVFSNILSTEVAPIFSNDVKEKTLYIIPNFDDNEATMDSMDDESNLSIPRVVNASQIIPYTEKSLVPWLCSIIQKMYQCPKTPVSSISNKQIYFKLT